MKRLKLILLLVAVLAFLCVGLLSSQALEPDGEILPTPGYPPAAQVID